MLKSYIRQTALPASGALLMIGITDAVLLFSSAWRMGRNDIVYLNILLAVTTLAFWISGYALFRARYLKLKQALQDGADTDSLLPEDGSFYSALLRDTVARKNALCNEKISEYEENLDELNSYMTKWVHEIKIPISVMELIVENMEDNGSASKNLRLELERIRFLVNQVLYAGRAAHYAEDLSLGEFNLGKAVKEAVKRNAQLFMLKNMEVSLNTLDFDVLNDEKWISYILDQILNNAGKYAEKDGKVEIFAEEDRDTVRLHIRDNGMGIPEQDIRRIFDRGFTGENGRKTAKSTGMGMYYSKKMAEKLRIGIEAYSKVGEYTEFVVAFYKVGDYFKVT